MIGRGPRTMSIHRCGATIERAPSGIRLRFCKNRVTTWGKKCWLHR